MTTRLPADALQEALEGVSPTGTSPAIREAVMVASRLSSLLPNGPDTATSERLTGGFEKRLQRAAPPRWLHALAPWAGAGPVPRPLIERMAAGAVVFGLLTGGGSAAATGDPLAFGKGVADFARNVVVNLGPSNGSSDGAQPTPELSPTPSATPGASPSPEPSPSPEATPTPDDEHEEEDEHDASPDGEGLE